LIPIVTHSGDSDGSDKSGGSEDREKAKVAQKWLRGAVEKKKKKGTATSKSTCRSATGMYCLSF